VERSKRKAKNVLLKKSKIPDYGPTSAARAEKRV
jgi:hypothetical protein